MQELQGKVAFVTGAASGIGFGIATALARAGCKLMACDIEGPALDEAVVSLKAGGYDVDGVLADVSLKPDLGAAAEATIDRFGKVHILVNNAGVGGAGVYGRWTDDGWAWVLGVNLWSVIWGFEIFAPLIETHGEGGHVVSTSSMAGILPGSASAYAVTKAGVVTLSEGMRRALASKGIGVSVLCPGPVATRIVDGRRNIPERFAAGIEPAPSDPEVLSQIQFMRDFIAEGADPLWVGELVREGVEGDWPYIMTDAAYEPAFDARVAEIKAGFERVRSRAVAA